MDYFFLLCGDLAEECRLPPERGLPLPDDGRPPPDEDLPRDDGRLPEDGRPLPDDDRPLPPAADDSPCGPGGNSAASAAVITHS